MADSRSVERASVVVDPRGIGTDRGVSAQHSGLRSKTVTVWNAPTSPRGYRSKAAAYLRWAKDIIRAKCSCWGGERLDGPGPERCRQCERLFTVPMWACTECGTPDAESPGERCHTCERGGRCTVPTRVHDSARYQKVKRRLARWLRWRTEMTAHEGERSGE